MSSTMLDDDDYHTISSATLAQSVREQDESMSDDDGDDVDAVPSFPSLPVTEHALPQSYSRVLVPPHRFTPLRTDWLSLYEPIVSQMRLQIKFNPKRRCVELRVSPLTTDASALSKATDFVRAYMLGFEVKDAIALLRVEDLFIDSFELKDVKEFHGEHLSRAIGRIAGQGGKTKFTIENATRTRIVLADTHVHILGAFTAINIAKNAIVRLIMGAPPAKIFAQMHGVAARAKERF